MAFNFMAPTSFEDTLDEQIARLKAKLTEPWAVSCNCMLALDECRRCKLTARLTKLENVVRSLRELK